MGVGDYLQGFVLLGLLLGAAGYAAVRIAAAWLPRLDGAPRIAALGMLAAGVLFGIHLLCAALGVLERAPVAILALLVLAGAWRLPRRRRTPRRPLGATPLELGVAAFAVAALALYAVAIAVDLGATPLTNIDTLSFHLPGVARWIQSQSIWQIDQFLPGQAQGYYPGTGNIVQLAAVLPWHSDFLVRFVNLPFFALAGIATYASGRELGAPVSSAAAAAAAALSVPAVTTYVVHSPTPDPVMYAGFACGVLFLLRHHRTHDRADLILAALGLGIAFGSRWYGVSSVAVVAAVWLAALIALRANVRRVAADAAVLGGIVTLVGAVWLLRNLVEAGNPVYPVEVTVFGETLFDAPRDIVRELAGWRISDYVDDPALLADYILPAWESELAYPALGLVIAALVAGALATRIAAARARVTALAGAAVAAVLAYAVTPYTALGLEGAPIATGSNARYAVPALLLAAPAAAWLFGRAGGARVWLEALLAIATLDAIRRGVDVSAGALALAAAATVVLGAAMWLARSDGAARRTVAGGCAAACVLVAVGLYVTQRRFLDDRYADAPPAVAAAIQRSEPGALIGIAGAWPVTTLSPVLPLFGPRLDNRVEYVGEIHDGMLRPHADAAGFTTALREGSYDLLLIGSDAPLGFAAGAEVRWARRSGYRVIAADADFTLLEP